MNLWGVNVNEKTEQRVAIPEDRDLLITRLSLGPEKQQSTAPTVAWLINHDKDEEKYVLGTLRPNTCEQFEVDVNIAAESEFSLKVTGPGTVYFVGYFNKLPSYDSYSDFDDEDIPSGEEDGSLEERIRAYMGGDDSSGASDYEEGGNVEELSPSDSDIDVEDDKAGMKSPVKGKQLEQILPKPQEQKLQNQPQADGEKKKKKKKKNKQGQPGQPGQPQQNKPQGQPQQNKPQNQQPAQKNQNQSPNQNPGDQQKKKKKNKKRKDGEQGGNPNKKQKTQ
jgi:hypothetical protein